MLCNYGRCGEQATAKKRPLCKAHYQLEKERGRLAMYALLDNPPSEVEEREIRTKIKLSKEKRKITKKRGRPKVRIMVECANPKCSNVKEMIPSIAKRSRFHFCDWDCRAEFNKALNDPVFYEETFGGSNV